MKANNGGAEQRPRVNGSRFAALTEDTNEGKDKEGETDMETNEEREEVVAPLSSDAVEKGKKPIGTTTDDMEGVEICTSDPSLINSFNSTSSSDLGKMKEVTKNLAG